MYRSWRVTARPALVAALAWGLAPIMALADEGFEEPVFAMPVIARSCRDGGGNPQSVSVFRSRGDSVLSVLRATRETPSGGPGRFVKVGPHAPRADAHCIIDVLLQRPLEEPRTVGVDLRGSEMKEPGTVTRLTIEIGPQRHVFDHAPGQTLENRGPQLKRFQLELPTGTTRFRIAVSGHAERVVEAGAALIGFDSLDLCFMDPEEPEFCGGPGYPNPRATSL